MGSATDRYILLGAAHGFVIGDFKSITEGSVFLFEREHELQNVLLEAYLELAFAVDRFDAARADILNNGTPELAEYIRQINAATFDIAPDATVELHAVDLSTYFKIFLLLAKATLDKMVPLYSYSYYDNIKQFSDKGARLIRAIKNNKRISRVPQFIKLIEDSKREWIDDLIYLRDDYAHYSNLPAYQNFTMRGDRANQRRLSSIQDFTPPTVSVRGVQIEALDYMVSIKAKMVSFLREFLLLCEFVPGRRPRHYLHCECGYVFAKRLMAGENKGKLALTSEPLEMIVKDRALDYAVIVCPKCRQTTDTDIKFWREEGFDSGATR